MENCYENAVLGPSALQQLEVENVISISDRQGTINRFFRTVLAVKKSDFSLSVRFRFLILSYKKLYRKQPVAFLITEHIFFFEKLDLCVS